MRRGLEHFVRGRVVCVGLTHVYQRRYDLIHVRTTGKRLWIHDPEPL